MSAAPKFTPGPWTKQHTHQDEATRASLAYICGPGCTAPCEIATVYGCDHDDGEQHANARLIAAAPELYEALRKLSDASRSYLEYMDAVDLEILEAARATLAKVSQS